MLIVIEKKETGTIKESVGKNRKTLWANMISLNEYKGNFDIDLNYVISRREARYAEEKNLFNQFGYYF
jgi:hypothetical protein